MARALEEPVFDRCETLALMTFDARRSNTTNQTDGTDHLNPIVSTLRKCGMVLLTNLVPASKLAGLSGSFDALMPRGGGLHERASSKALRDELRGGRTQVFPPHAAGFDDPGIFGNALVHRVVDR
jgi:hypothetical protein